MEWNSIFDKFNTIFSILPIKNYFEVIKDWGHNVINKIDTRLFHDEIVSLNKQLIQEKKEKEELITFIKETLKNIKEKENIYEKTKEIISEAKLNNENLLNTLNNIYQHINYKLLIPTICILGTIFLYKLINIIIKKYFNNLIDKYWILKKIFPNKYIKDLEKKKNINQNYETIIKNNEEFKEHLTKIEIEINENYIKHEKNLELLKKEWESLEKSDTQDILEEEKNIEFYKKLYGNICYTHINKLLNINLDCINLYDLKKRALNRYFTNIEEFEKSNEIFEFDERYLMCIYLSNKIENNINFFKFVDTIIDENITEKNIQNCFDLEYKKYMYSNNTVDIEDCLLRKKYLKNKILDTFCLLEEEKILKNFNKSVQSLNYIEFCDKNMEKQKKLLLNINKDFCEQVNKFNEKKYIEINNNLLDKKINIVTEIGNNINCSNYKILTNNTEEKITLINTFKKSIINETYNVGNQFEPFQGEPHFLNESISINVI